LGAWTLKNGKRRENTSGKLDAHNCVRKKKGSKPAQGENERKPNKGEALLCADSGLKGVHRPYGTMKKGKSGYRKRETGPKRGEKWAKSSRRQSNKKKRPNAGEGAYCDGVDGQNCPVA